MNITITGILDAKSRLVSFNSPAGNASGVWRGESEPTLASYTVECEVPDEVNEWTLTQSPYQGIRESRTLHGARIVLTGLAERVDDDSVVALRIQTDILLVELPNAVRKVKPGESLTFAAPPLELFPYEL
ncbi:hypothetical protein ACWD4B_15860 [Streptomyces sp. NPDC002536]